MSPDSAPSPGHYRVTWAQDLQGPTPLSERQASTGRTAGASKASGQAIWNLATPSSAGREGQAFQHVLVYLTPSGAHPRSKIWVGRPPPLHTGTTVTGTHRLLTSLCSSLSRPPGFQHLRARGFLTAGGGWSHNAWFKSQACRLRLGRAGAR